MELHQHRDLYSTSVQFKRRLQSINRVVMPPPALPSPVTLPVLAANTLLTQMLCVSGKGYVCVYVCVTHTCAVCACVYMRTSVRVVIDTYAGLDYRWMGGWMDRWIDSGR